jgi:hypothetical protein
MLPVDNEEAHVSEKWKQTLGQDAERLLTGSLVTSSTATQTQSVVYRLYVAQERFLTQPYPESLKTGPVTWWNDLCLVPLIRALFNRPSATMQDDYRKACEYLVRCGLNGHELWWDELPSWFTGEAIISIRKTLQLAMYPRWFSAKVMTVGVEAWEVLKNTLFFLGGDPRKVQYASWQQSELTILMQLHRQIGPLSVLSRDAALLNETPDANQGVSTQEEAARERVRKWANVRKALTFEMNELLDRLSRMEPEALDDWNDTFWQLRQLQDQVKRPEELLEDLRKFSQRAQLRRLELELTLAKSPPTAAKAATPPAPKVVTPPTIRILDPGYVVDPEPVESSVEIETPKGVKR